MAVAFDAGGALGFSFTAPATLSVPLTPTGLDRLLISGIAWREETVTFFGVAVTAVTFNGTPLSFDALAAIGVYTNELWHLVAPDTGGPFNLDVTFTPGDPSESPEVIAVIGGNSFTGVDQAAPLGVVQTATGSNTTPTVVVPSVSANNLVMDALSLNSNSPNPVPDPVDQTERWDVQTSNIFGIRGASSTAAGLIGNRTMNWTLSASRQWTLLGVEILEVSSFARVRDPLRYPPTMVPRRR